MVEWRLQTMKKAPCRCRKVLGQWSVLMAVPRQFVLVVHLVAVYKFKFLTKVRSDGSYRQRNLKIKTVLWGKHITM